MLYKWTVGTEMLISLTCSLKAVSVSGWYFNLLWQQNQVQIAFLSADCNMWTYLRISYSCFLKVQEEKSWDISIIVWSLSIWKCSG